MAYKSYKMAGTSLPQPLPYVEQSDGSRLYTLQTQKGSVSFTSTYSDVQAVSKLKDYVQAGKLTSPFAQDLSSKCTPQSSPKQLAWIHKLVHDAEQDAQPQQQQSAPLTKLIDLFHKAHAHLKKPAIVMMWEGSEFRVSRAPDYGKNPGWLYVQRRSTLAWADSVGEWVYKAKVNPQGGIVWAADSSAYKSAIAALLQALAEDPAKAAAEQGKLTGRCCFCNQALSDDKSTAVGYGPVCAEHYSLPWGEVKTDVQEPALVKPVKKHLPPSPSVKLVQPKQGPWIEAFANSDWTATASDFPAGEVPMLPTGKPFQLSDFTPVRDNEGELTHWVLTEGSTTYTIFND